MYEVNHDNVRRVWKPRDEELAVEAMQDVGAAPADVELPKDANVSLESRDAQKVVARYKELHIEKYGTESQYYEE